MLVRVEPKQQLPSVQYISQKKVSNFFFLFSCTIKVFCRELLCSVRDTSPAHCLKSTYRGWALCIFGPGSGVFGSSTKDTNCPQVSMVCLGCGQDHMSGGFGKWDWTAWHAPWGRAFCTDTAAMPNQCSIRAIHALLGCIISLAHHLLSDQPYASFIGGTTVQNLCRSCSSDSLYISCWVSFKLVKLYNCWNKVLFIVMYGHKHG